MIIQGVKLHPGQLRILSDILTSEAKFHVLVASRQAGKTVLLEQMALNHCINENCRALWVTPVYSISKHVFTEICEGLAGSGAIQEYLKAEQTIKFTSGSELIFKSASNADNIRGLSVDYLFVDEMSYIDDYDFNAAIRPTTNVRGKKVYLASTPKGRNLFYNMAKLGEDPANPLYKLHFMLYKENPYYDLQEVEDARKTLPDKIFRQEYLGEFISDGGSVFENIESLAVIKEYLREKVRGDRYFAGLDIGKVDDFTCLTIMNQNREVVFVLRINNLSWDMITRTILKWLVLFQPLLYMEVNSAADVLYENIRKHYSRIIPFVTSNVSKQDLIEQLIYQFSDNKIKIPAKELCPEMYRELEIFSFEYSKKSRAIFYSAPPGFHDDTVISLALANKAVQHVGASQISWSTI